MTALQSLVVGVDGSHAAANALAWAAEHISPGGRLHVVYANEESAPVPDEWIAPAGGEVAIATHVMADAPADTLMEVAARAAVDGIVVGAHGAGDSRYVLGRVTSKLLQDADVPIFVINPNQTDEGPASGTIVACVGYGAASDAAAEWAADRAASSGRPLCLLHVVGGRPMIPRDSPSDTIASYFGPDVVREWAQADLDAHASDLGTRHPDLELMTRLERGPHVRSIEAASGGAELVVLGKRRSNPITGRLLGHRLHHLVVRITAPVAVVPCTVER